MDKVKVRLSPDSVFTVEGEIRDIFAVLTSLKKDQHNPEVMLFDQEMKDWTCWQPLKEAA